MLLIFIVLFVSKYGLDYSGYQSVAVYLPAIVIKSIGYVVNVMVAICGIGMCYSLIRSVYENRQLQTSQLGGGRISGSNIIGNICDTILHRELIRSVFYGASSA